MDNLNIPVAIFFFNRPDTTVRVIERIATAKPKKLYLICDGGRTPEEHNEVLICRKLVEESISWDCEIIKNYADTNRGVYANIGLGAKWVFTREEYAIFLEDDNLPDITFFRFCEEMLLKYQYDTRVLWVCGTNYLQKYEPEDNSSYVFTKHLMPCGWASWANKYNRFYDGELSMARDTKILNRLKQEYDNKSLYRQQLYNILGTIDKLDDNPKRSSWDYQMAFSLRINGLYGISPKVNLIENIGVDGRSTHGGNSMRKVMTRRFCGINSFALEFPLVHPKTIIKDITYERRVGNIILIPITNRIAIKIARLIKPLFGVGKYESLPAALRKKIKSI